MNITDPDFQNAKSKAKDLYEVADQLENLANRMLPTELEHAIDVWKGDNGKILWKKIEKIQEKLEKDAKKVRECADFIAAGNESRTMLAAGDLTSSGDFYEI
ncbi:hypothetical protein VSQ48_15830 [Candidatus Ventrimonas sp. KK005]